MLTKVDARWRMKILADVAWRQRLERQRPKSAPTSLHLFFLFQKTAADMIQLEIRLIHSPTYVTISEFSARPCPKRHHNSVECVSELRLLRWKTTADSRICGLILKEQSDFASIETVILVTKVTRSKHSRGK